MTDREPVALHCLQTHLLSYQTQSKKLGEKETSKLSRLKIWSSFQMVCQQKVLNQLRRFEWISKCSVFHNVIL